MKKKPTNRTVPIILRAHFGISYLRKTVQAMEWGMDCLKCGKSIFLCLFLDKLDNHFNNISRKIDNSKVIAKALSFVREQL